MTGMETDVLSAEDAMKSQDQSITSADNEIKSLYQKRLDMTEHLSDFQKYLSGEQKEGQKFSGLEFQFPGIWNSRWIFYPSTFQMFR